MKPKYVQFWEFVHIFLFVIFALSLLRDTFDEKSKKFFIWVKYDQKLEPDLLDYFETLDFCWKMTYKHESLLRVGQTFWQTFQRIVRDENADNQFTTLTLQQHWCSNKQKRSQEPSKMTINQIWFRILIKAIPKRSDIFTQFCRILSK